MKTPPIFEKHEVHFFLKEGGKDIEKIIEKDVLKLDTGQNAESRAESADGHPEALDPGEAPTAHDGKI